MSERTLVNFPSPSLVLWNGARKALVPEGSYCPAYARLPHVYSTEPSGEVRLNQCEVYYFFRQGLAESSHFGAGNNLTVHQGRCQTTCSFLNNLTVRPL